MRTRFGGAHTIGYHSQVACRLPIRLFPKLPTVLSSRRPAAVKLRFVLKRGRERDHNVIPIRRACDLQPDGQPGLAKAAWDRDGRQAVQIPRRSVSKEN